MRRVVAGLATVIFLAAAVVSLAQRPAMPVGQITGAGAPGMNCLVGQKYFRTDAVAGSNMYLCTALPNVWTQSGAASVGERYSWALCLGVDCTLAADLANAVLVGRAVTVTVCYGKAKTAPTGTDLNIIINRDGANNIFATDLTIPAGSTAVVTEAGMSASAALAAGQYLTIDITQVGAVVPGQNVSVVCIGN